MMLGLDNSELLILLEFGSLLKAKVDEAMRVHAPGAGAAAAAPLGAAAPSGAAASPADAAADGGDQAESGRQSDAGPGDQIR